MEQPTLQFLPVEGKPREQIVPLDFPLQYRERRIDAIAVRRMNVAQLEAYLEALKAGTGSVPAMLYFPDGEPIPDEVLAGLDADDDLRVHEVLQSFLPLRLRQVLTQTLPTGGDTLPSSQAD